MPHLEMHRSRGTILTLAGVAIIIAALYFAQTVLLPLALAILLSFMLTPLVNWLERIRINRIVAVLLVVCCCFAAVGATGYGVWRQLAQLAGNLPSYRENIHERAAAIQSSADAIMNKASRLLAQIGRDFPHPTSSPAAPAPSFPPNSPLNGPAGARPVPVQIVQPPPSTITIIQRALGPLIEPLLTALLVIVFIIFILIRREDLRDRVIFLFSASRLKLTTQAMDDATHRISRFLLTQLLVNVCYGIVLSVGLYSIGVPNALIWGPMATIFRFIPYIGIWMAAALPLLLSVAVSHTWVTPVLVLGLYLVLEIIVANFVEPHFYGASTGISSIAVLVAAVFWTWLWGIVGLLLATPMTVLLAVLGKHMPQFATLNILLGDEPVMDLKTRVYQRLLAWDTQEPLDLLEHELKQSSFIEVYDRVLIPALALAEEDCHRGEIDERRREFIHDSINQMIAELAEELELPDPAPLSPPMSSQQLPGKRNGGTQPAAQPVLCLPANNPADQIVARMLVQVLQSRGCHAAFIGDGVLSSELGHAAALINPRILCISAMPPSALSHARYILKRLRTRIHESNYIVGLWTTPGDAGKPAERLAAIAPVTVVRNLSEAVDRIIPLVQSLSTRLPAPVQG